MWGGCGVGGVWSEIRAEIGKMARQVSLRGHLKPDCDVLPCLVSSKWFSTLSFTHWIAHENVKESFQLHIRKVVCLQYGV